MSDTRLIAAITAICFAIFATTFLSTYVEQAWSIKTNQGTIIAALLGVLGAALTALGAFWLWQMQHRTDRAVDDKARRDRKHRLLIALRVELSLNAEAQFKFFAPETADELKDKLKATIDAAEDGEGGMPMAVVSQTNDVYDHIKEEIADLPEEVIAPVINYYQQDEYVSQLLTQFAEGDFDELSKERRKASIDALFEAGKGALEAAIEAFSALDASLIKEDVTDGEAARKMRYDVRNMEKMVEEAGAPDGSDPEAAAEAVKG